MLSSPPQAPRNAEASQRRRERKESSSKLSAFSPRSVAPAAVEGTYASRSNTFCALPFVESLQQRVEARVITQLVELRIGSDAINNQRIMPVEGDGQPINGFVGLAERGVYRDQMIGDAESVRVCFQIGNYLLRLIAPPCGGISMAEGSPNLADHSPQAVGLLQRADSFRTHSLLRVTLAEVGPRRSVVRIHLDYFL